MPESTNPRATLEAMTSSGLRLAIRAAVREHSLPSGWMCPKTHDKAELIEHIDDICNEFGLHVQEDGSLAA